MKWMIILLLTLSASRITSFSNRSYFVIWNVGQGQWATQVSAETCLHFDMGGEFFPWQKIHLQCAQKENRLFLSHADDDHINALRRKASVRKLGLFCLEVEPLQASAKKKALWKDLPPCSDVSTVSQWQPSSAGRLPSNDLSQVFVSRKNLMSGDSPQFQERIWIQRLPLQDVDVMVLGHHGSKTSTSELLMGSLPSLKVAVSSARWHRYGHPHPAVVARLKRHRIALLRTEDWGNIWIEQTVGVLPVR